MSTLKSQTVRGLKWQAVEIAGRQLLSLAVFTILARLLDPTDFGLLGMVAVYLAFVALFVEQGIGAAIIQRKDLEPEHLDSAFWFSVGCAVVLTAVTIALAGPVALLFDEPRLAPLLRWGSLTLIAGALSGVHIALFVRDMDFRRPAMRTILANLGGGVVGVWMALSGCGVWALIGQQLAANLGSAAFVWSASTWRPRVRFSLLHLRELRDVSTSVLFTTALWFVASRADQFFIGRGLGTDMLGQYVVGGRLAEMGRIALGQPLSSVCMPAFSKVQDDHQRLRRVIVNAVALSSVISFPAFIGLATVATTVIPLVFGDRWTEAGVVLRWLAMYQLLAILLAFPHPALVATANLRGYVIINLVCASGAVLACWIGVSIGVEAVVAGLIINLAVTGFLALLLLNRRIGLTPWMYIRPCLGPFAASLLMVGAILAVRWAMPAGVPRSVNALVQVLSGAAVYTGLAGVLAGESVRQILMMVRSGLGMRISAAPVARIGA